MSTAHEANTAAALGLEVAAVSCIANLAAGISPKPLSHSEVLSMVRQAGHNIALLLNEFLRLLSISAANRVR
jgi:purine-nucleoside phosphorylase